MRGWAGGAALLLALVGATACPNDPGTAEDAGTGGGEGSTSSSGDPTSATSSSGGSSGSGATSSSGGTGSSTSSGSPTDGGVADGGDAGPAGLAITDVVPNTGPVDARCGGTTCRVRVNGIGFSAPSRMRVFFGAYEAPAAGILLVSQTAITTFLPQASGPGVVDVTVKIVDAAGMVVDEATSVGAFTYYNALRVNDVTPAAVGTAGGTPVTITGEGFEPDQLLLLGGRAATQFTVAADGLSATAVAPPHEAGRVDVEVVSRFGAAKKNLGIRYVAPLVLQDVAPAVGPLAGGNRVTLWGSGFTTDTRVTFGGVTARVLDVASDEEMLVGAPAGSGTVDVTVSDTLLPQQNTLTAAYTFADGTAPLLASVSPRTGRSMGGTRVTLRGRGLSGQNLAVLFGSVPATGVTVVDATHLTALAPAGTGTVDVRVNRDGQAPLTLAGAFTYRDGVTLTSASPQGGPSAGGTAVTVTGQNLDAACTFTLGGLPVTATVDSATSATFAAPAGSPGAADLSVRCPDGTDDTLANAFAYAGPLSVMTLSPIRGSMAGGTLVYVRGTGFASRRSVLKVWFGMALASSLNVLSDSLLTVTAPPSGPGLVHVRAEAGTESSTRERAFTYYDPTGILGGARGGAIDGSINVAVFDWQTRLPIPGVLAVAGTETGAQYQAFTDERGLAVLSGPELVGPQTVTAAHCNFEFVTVGGVNAADITLWLNAIFPPRCGPPPNPGSPPPGTPLPPPPVISGKVTGFSKELFDPANLGPDEVAAAFVFHTWPGPFGPGPPNNWTMAASQFVFVEGGQYEIPAAWRTGPMAVLAMAGIYNTNTQAFRVAQLGFNRGLVADRGGVYRNRDIVLSIPLTKRLTVQFPDAPYEPPTLQSNLMQAAVNLGGEGGHPIIGWDREGFSGETSYVLENFAEAPGDLFTFVALFSETGGQSAPYSLVFQDGEGVLGNAITLGPLMGFPTPLAPADGGAMVGRTLQIRAPNGPRPSYYEFNLFGLDGTQWTAYLEGTRNKLILPRFEDFPTNEYAPLNMGAGGVFATLNTIYVPGFDYGNWTYLDMFNGRVSWSVMQYRFINAGN